MKLLEHSLNIPFQVEEHLNSPKSKSSSTAAPCQTAAQQLQVEEQLNSPKSKSSSTAAPCQIAAQQQPQVEEQLKEHTRSYSPYYYVNSTFKTV
ncbi:hypothetical protein AXF42_Ash013566 [Apostasia shenzhenica]|uniref:Uncharacterized protein n=1 Tax=Apostasia shenzhenica TaxID=1088818 RepID=A0A2I0AP97_9ASPA|nr:hypothetical protein AXF42_Ash013566 [Apostasia shenzhenica]